jgi:hypothetical protein
MDKVFGFIKGYRTYITAIFMLINHIGVIAGVWTWDNAVVIDSVLAPFGLAFLRASFPDKTGKTGPN